MENNSGKGTHFLSRVDSSQTVTQDPEMIDWDHLGFEVLDTATIGGTQARADGPWEPFTLAPYGEIRMPISATALNYGQSVFEGLKAVRGADNRVRIFRVEANAVRMQESARRLSMKTVPIQTFIDGVIRVVRSNIDFTPPHGKGSLYIRPLLYGTGRTLPPMPSSEYVFLIYVCPVGLYFKGLSCISISVTTEYQRAAEKGVGRVKAAGNYASSFYPVALAKENGYAETLFLDASGTFVEEVGTANILMVKGDQLMVAESPAILPGITRNSLAELAENELGLDVSLERVKLDRILGINEFEADGPADELFCTGTAAMVSPVGNIHFQGRDYPLNDNQVGPITARLHHRLFQIQNGLVEDTYGWTTTV